ncbi:MAG: hypothetical protein R2695_19390 [Acidimicrobiales bacterium]
MFDDLCDLLSSDPVECLTRSQLVDRIGAATRAISRLEAYRGRLLCAIDGLGDKGPRRGGGAAFGGAGVGPHRWSDGRDREEARAAAPHG